MPAITRSEEAKLGCFGCTFITSLFDLSPDNLNTHSLCVIFKRLYIPPVDALDGGVRYSFTAFLM